jgi:hypothetical protein
MATETKLQASGEITPRMRAFLLALVTCAGHIGNACVAAGISRECHYRWSRGYLDTKSGRRYEASPAYLKALEAALAISAEVLEDEAIRRGYEGVKRYKFGPDGEPKRHPEQCECGHELVSHARPRKPDHVPDGEDVDQTVRPCLACSCEDFKGAPYWEHDYSDKLLLALLGARKPRQYATKRIETTKTLRNINWDALPDALVARIARGENPLAVLASAADEGAERMLASGAVLGGPGAARAAGGEGSEGERAAGSAGSAEG